jgi:hypothetical protein
LLGTRRVQCSTASRSRKITSTFPPPHWSHAPPFITHPTSQGGTRGRAQRVRSDRSGHDSRGRGHSRCAHRWTRAHANRPARRRPRPHGSQYVYEVGDGLRQVIHRSGWHASPTAGHVHGLTLRFRSGASGWARCALADP